MYNLYLSGFILPNLYTSHTPPELLVLGYDGLALRDNGDGPLATQRTSTR